MAIDAQQLWADKYAARFASAKFAEDEARERAFVADTYEVCGERIRSLTPRDVLHLQAIGSPFVYPTQEIKPAHVLQFLWALSVKNTGRFTWLRRRAMIRRVMARRSKDPINDAIAEVCDYVAGQFIDAPRGACEESKPLGACWLAPLMVRLSANVGHRDPFDGCTWADAPLSRAFQYMKAVRQSEDDKFKDTSPSDKILSDWQAEVNAENVNKGGTNDGI